METAEDKLLRHLRRSPISDVIADERYISSRYERGYIDSAEYYIHLRNAVKLHNWLYEEYINESWILHLEQRNV